MDNSLPRDDRALLLRPELAAEMLSISRSTLYELLRRGEIVSVRIGRSRRVPRRALDDYVNRLQADHRPPR